MLNPPTQTASVIADISTLENKPITRQEWRWVWVWSIVTVVLTLLPFLWAWLIAPPGSQFMGLLFNAADGNSYLAKMQQGHTDWLFHLTYSPEPSQGTFIFVLYLLLGRLAAVTGLSNVVVFHAARLVFGLALLLVSYRFISSFLAEVRQRRLAFLLLCFGAGIGWLLLPFVGLAASVDTWVAESLTFFSITANPHFPLATLLLLLAIMGLRDIFQMPGRIKWQTVAKTALVAFALGWVHPFLLISLAAIMGVYLLRLNLAARHFTLNHCLALAWVGLVGAPGPLYTYVATNTDPVLRAWMSQNQTLSPWPWFYLTGYGLLAVLAGLGVWRVERRQWPGDETRRQRFQLLTTWVGVTVVLLYVPVSFQRRFVEGLQLPVVGLATLGFLEVGWAWYKKHQPKASLARWSGRLILFCSVSTFVVPLLFTPFGNTRFDPVTGVSHFLYYYDDEVAGFKWLAAHTQPEDTVMAGPVDGSFIPAWAGNHVFDGHWLETIDSQSKLKLLGQFFQARTPPAGRNQLIQQYNLHYLYYGAEEKNLSNNTPPFDPTLAGWPIVFQNQRVTIYKLTVN